MQSIYTMDINDDIITVCNIYLIMIIIVYSLFNFVFSPMFPIPIPDTVVNDFVFITTYVTLYNLDMFDLDSNVTITILFVHNMMGIKVYHIYSETVFHIIMLLYMIIAWYINMQTFFNGR